jgi:hypothetical protein
VGRSPKGGGTPPVATTGLFAGDGDAGSSTEAGSFGFCNDDVIAGVDDASGSCVS